MAPAPGDPAPDFALVDDHGATVRLADLRGATVVLYIYPKDDTPGCTRQACALRDAWADLQATGAHILGVSPDDVASHVRFRDRYALPFPLLADPELAVIGAYGAYGTRPNGTEGVIRSTFVIDAGGVVTHAWVPVDPDGHLALVREALGA